MHRNIRVLSIVLFLALGVAGTAQNFTAETPLPRVVRFSGVVRDADGKPRRAGMVDVTFSIYKEQQDQSPLWIETQRVPLDAEGRYSALLGATNSAGLPVSIFVAGEARWIGVRVVEEGSVEQPRVQLVSVPYALAAGD